LNACDVAADRFDRRVEFSLTAARDEDVGALFDEELRCSEAYSSGAASYDRHFSL
jgi:hypothetical protein